MASCYNTEVQVNISIKKYDRLTESDKSFLMMLMRHCESCEDCQIVRYNYSIYQYIKSMLDHLKQCCNGNLNCLCIEQFYMIQKTLKEKSPFNKTLLKTLFANDSEIK